MSLQLVPVSFRQARNFVAQGDESGASFRVLWEAPMPNPAKWGVAA